jgi:hypothetical protein
LGLLEEVGPVSFVRPPPSWAARDAAYEKVIGAEFARFAAEEAVPAIEVRRDRGRPARAECEVWLTSGMSDVAMKN